MDRGEPGGDQVFAPQDLHTSSEVAAVDVEKVPSGQSVHWRWFPGDALYFPAGQGWQVSGAEVLGTKTGAWPVLHVQDSLDVSPVPLVSELVGHWRHEGSSGAAAEGEYVFTGHWMHEEMGRLPTTSLYVPSGHGRHWVVLEV